MHIPARKMSRAAATAYHTTRSLVCQSAGLSHGLPWVQAWQTQQRFDVRGILIYEAVEKRRQFMLPRNSRAVV